MRFQYGWIQADINYFPTRFVGLCLYNETYFFYKAQFTCNGLREVLWHNMLPIKPGATGRTPSLFDKCTRLLYVHYTTHRTNGFMSHPKDEVSWLCVLFKDTCVTTSQSHLVGMCSEQDIHLCCSPNVEQPPSIHYELCLFANVQEISSNLSVSNVM